ncbi:nuclear transport factor 2 family protein [Corallococcus exiguus]|uniref:nuclear transport factor 2 family protein n=1 Tax=Corallococcus exiguus TaxID=83462 RepID=UPI0015605E0C|nr:nuclear transport factor 2 family protein [Corallococcus exiguus]NRD43550.1 nuclear transport factor 2 family protein [Corallococcus exiguus]
MNDTSEIRETIERFHDAVNQRNPQAIGGLFTADGVWEVAPPFEHRFIGPEAIAAGLAGTIGRTVVLVQTCAPIVIERIDARYAKARTSMQEWGRFEDGSSMRVAGTYFDELVNTGDGRWRFTHRCFVAHYADTEPVPGTVFPVGR